MSLALMAGAFLMERLCEGKSLSESLEITGAILRDLSPAGHARAVEVLDRQSGKVEMLCGGATKFCWASGGRWTRFQKKRVPELGLTTIIWQPTPTKFQTKNGQP